MLRMSATLALLFLDAPLAQPPIEDDYLWLQRINGKQALHWVKAQNQRTVETFRRHPAFKATRKQLLSIYNSQHNIAAPTLRADHVYNLWKDSAHAWGLWRRCTLASYLTNEPAWETVLDIDALSAIEDTNWVYRGAKFLYPDFSRCLISLSRGGADASQIREFDLKSKSFFFTDPLRQAALAHLAEGVQERGRSPWEVERTSTIAEPSTGRYTSW